MLTHPAGFGNASDAVDPFRVDVSDDVIEDLKARLARTPCSHVMDR